MPKLSPINIDPNTFLYQHCSLPVLPEVITKLHEIKLSESVSAKHVAKLVSTDTALVAQILKIVNSAYYSLPVEITDIEFAVAYLGLHEVYNIVLTLTVIKTLKTIDQKSFGEIWFHSLFTAMCAKLLAKKFDPILNTNELWSGALLHDIGKMVYLKFFPKHYIELRRFSIENKCLFSEAEQHYSLPSSSYFGTLLCDRWKLPLKIKQACSSHSLKDLLIIKVQTPKDSFKFMITISNLIAVLTNDPLNDDKKNEISDLIKKTLNIDNSEFLMILSEILELKEETNRLM